jgi:hypothetical protein
MEGMRRNLVTFRVKLIYTADGLTRPMTYTDDVKAESCTEALQLTVNFIRSAYVSGFQVAHWTIENLDKPVMLNYVSDSEAVVGDILVKAQRFREELGL